jgi:hypothetical protein
VTRRPEPILLFPQGFVDPVFVAGHELQQRWRGLYRGKPSLLRLGRFPAELAPVVDPGAALEMMMKLDASLGLSAIVVPVAAGSCAGGFFAIEPHAGDADGRKLGTLGWAATVELVRPIARDLAALHRARKWHGGVRPTRIRRTKRGGALTGLAWASMVSMLTGDQLRAIDRPEAPHRAPFVAPELLALGPEAAGRPCDVYGLARSILQLATGGPAADLRADQEMPRSAAELLRAASGADPAGRPVIAELVAVLER